MTKQYLINSATKIIVVVGNCILPGLGDYRFRNNCIWPNGKLAITLGMVAQW